MAQINLDLTTLNKGALELMAKALIEDARTHSPSIKKVRRLQTLNCIIAWEGLTGQMHTALRIAADKMY